MRRFDVPESGFFADRGAGAYTPPTVEHEGTGGRRAHIVKILAWALGFTVIIIICLIPVWLHISSDCPGFGKRNAAGACVQCLNDNDCSTTTTAGALNKATCNVKTGTCVECTQDANCTVPGTACVSTVCAGSCTKDADCSAPTGRCNTTTKRCTQCLTNSDCGSKQQCGSNGLCACDCGANEGCLTGTATCLPTCGHCTDDYPVCGSNSLCAKCVPGSINAMGATCLASGMGYGTCGGVSDCVTGRAFPACTDNICSAAFPDGTPIGFVSTVQQEGSKSVDTIAQSAWNALSISQSDQSADVAFVTVNGKTDVIVRASGFTAVRLAARGIADAAPAQLDPLAGLNLNNMPMAYEFLIQDASSGSYPSDFTQPFYIRYGSLYLGTDNANNSLIWVSVPQAWTQLNQYTIH